MPAYFSLIFSIRKKKNNKHLFKDFTNLLQENGFVYKCGFMEFESDTLADIVKINTAKLLEDFELGYDEHYSHDYRQCYWEYREFSEVRLFIYNSQEDDYFTFHIIVPEDEVYTYTETYRGFIEPITADLKAFALEAWKRRYITAIQSSLEGSEDVALEDIKAGVMPTTDPFSIVPASYLGDARKEGFNYTNIRRKGVLIERV